MPKNPAPPSPPRSETTFAAATLELADGVARICRLYGVSPMLGRLYAALYVSSGPISLEELCDEVGAAKSTVSVALRKLLSARIVRRLPPRGDRRDYYELVADPWAVLADWNRLYFEPELEMWKATHVTLESALASAADAPKGQDKAKLLERMNAWAEFTEIVEQMLGGLSSTRKPPEPARAIPVSFAKKEGKR